LFVYKAYRDDAAFEAHRNATSIAKFRGEAAGMGEESRDEMHARGLDVEPQEVIPG